MSRWRDLATIGVVLLLLMAGAGGAVDGPSHFASSGVTYQTNSGLEVTLGDDRDVGAVPFADDETFASDGVEIQSPGTASVRVNDQAFDGGSMSVRDIDASANDITLRRDDLTNDVRVDSGISDIIVSDVTLDDGTVDLEVVAGSETNVTVLGVPDVDGIQAVDSDGEAVAGTTDTSDNTAELTLAAGSYQLRLQDGPSVLSIRNLTTGDLVTNVSEATVEFFGADGTVEERTPTNGTIDMGGLPADERFAIVIDTNGTYVTRQAIIPSLLNQQTAWLLPDDSNTDTVEPRFTLEDPSKQFDSEESEIVLKRPIDRGNGTEFVAVAGDRVGLNGFDPVLERDQRYRVVVTNPDTGSERRLGEFTPTASEPVTLTVQDVEFDSVAEVDGLEWGTKYITNEEDTNEIKFIFRDEFETQSLEYEIVERGNDNNVLVSATTSGNVTVTETVPPGAEDTVWVVKWETTRANGETLSASRPVSTSRLPIGPGLDSKWQTAIAMVSLFAVAGLFGAASPGVGGIAVASTGGMFFMLGWLPDTTGGIMVLLALFVAVLAYAGRKAAGATT